jgi:hypothetical protein
MPRTITRSPRRGDHSLALHERRAPHKTGHIACDLRDLFPIRELAALAADGDVRDHAEDARAQFLAEAVHDREYGDEHGHTQRDADHRAERDEGDEMVAAFGACVA